jgi:hexosaminidase
MEVDMVIPRPGAETPQEGFFTLGPRTVLRGPGELTTAIRDALGPATGFALPSGTAAEDGLIEADVDHTLVPEAYRLTVEPSRVRLIGGGAAGVFYALQTLRQLLPPAILRSATAPGERWEIPAVVIEDAPRFSWRGGHLDVGRHFVPKADLLRLIDLLALHKFNVLHLHLTEDQGWRFESRLYPLLTEVGSWRRETSGDGTPHGGFYSQADLREVVAFAARRHITVVPEIDLPGHVQAAVAAYPELGNDPSRRIEVATGWGVITHVLNLEEKTLKFCADIIGEVTEIFPGRFLHVGGDECPTDEWSGSGRARERMRELGIGDVEEIQGWFTRRLSAILAEHGRSLVGWDEICDHGDVPGATIHAWRGYERGVEAARAGHDVIMSPVAPTYFDYYQSDRDDEPRTIGGHNTVENVYDWDPIQAELSEEEGRRVIGTQFQVWTEWQPTPRDVEYMSYPRACALAEVGWTSGPKDREDFMRRLAEHLGRLDALGVNYRPLEGPRPWQRGGTGARARV